MNFQELVVAVEHQLPIVVVILNNGYLGMVRQWQELFYSKRYSGVMLSQHGRRPNEDIAEKPVYLPDFVKLAEAHGLTGIRVTDRSQVEAAIRKAQATEGTVVIDFRVEQEDSVYPMVPAGADLHAMIRRPTVLVETPQDE